MKLVSSQQSAVSKFLSLAFIVLSFVSIGFAQDAGRASLSAQVAQVAEFEVNGLKVLVKRRPLSPTVAAGLFIRGGVKNVTAQNAGIENFMLSAMTEGSRTFPRDTLRRELARTGSSIGSSAGYDFSVVSLASTRQNFDRSWEIFTDIVLNPGFAAADVNLAKDRILTSLRDDSDDPDGFLQVLQNKVIYANHPYANDPRGSVETVSRFTAEDLRAYHRKAMQTSQLLLVIVGDLDATDLQKRITDSFGSLPKGSYKETPAGAFDFAQPTLDITTRALPTNYIQGVFDAPSLSNPDFYAMRVATTLLRDRVFEEVRVKRNLSYAPSADMNALGVSTGNIYVTAVDANQAISVMLNEIKNLRDEKVEEREISGVTGQFLTTYFVGQETNAAQAAELAKYELIGGGWRNSFSFLDKVKQVKPSDVQRVSQKYMKNLRFIVLGNPNAIKREIFLQKTVPGGQ
ncbi:MAG TPA: pitrilysin family protein [Pyrinomonadaceae bacterium]|nr:pitrilysin family protein [Pyrinomonadaceae bacterium]